MDATAQFPAPATSPREVDTPVTLPIDPTVFGQVWHCDRPDHRGEGCLFCDPTVPLPSRFTVPVKPCCQVLLDDECGCSDPGDDVFAQPIRWDLRTRQVA